MHLSKYIILIITILVNTFSILSFQTLLSQETSPRKFKYFKIAANNDDDSVFTKVQEEMQLHTKMSSFILIVNVLDENPSKHYVIIGEEADAYAVRANFYTLSKITREKLLRWDNQNMVDLQYLKQHYVNQWSEIKTRQQREESLKNEIDAYSEEISERKRTLNLNPNDSDVIYYIVGTYFRRGNVCENLEEYEKAISDYTKAIEILPKNSYAYFLRGHLYYRLKEYSKAIFDFTMSIEYNPSEKKYLSSKIIDCLYNRAENYYDAKEFIKAIYDYKNVIELDSNQQRYRHDDINNLCGLAYIGNKEYSNAILVYDKILENNPNYSLSYFYRGIAYCENKNMTKGCEDLQRAYILGIPNAKKMLDKYCNKK